jgi:hypothetical protein
VSVPGNQLEQLKRARTQYINYNQSRLKNGGQLMARLAEILAANRDGVAADFKRTGPISAAAGECTFVT